jgi:hypothetical protein
MSASADGSASRQPAGKVTLSSRHRQSRSRPDLLPLTTVGGGPGAGSAHAMVHDPRHGGYTFGRQVLPVGSLRK